MPYAASVTTANVTDRNGAIQFFREMGFSIPTLQAVLADGGYTDDNFANTISRLTGANVKIAKRSDTFVVVSKRWIVERSFAWLNKFRRLWKNCERCLDSYLSMVKLVLVSILLKRL